MFAETAEINPPAGYSWWWWAVLAAALLGLVLLWLRTWWVLRERPAQVADTLEQLRAQAQSRIDELHKQASTGQITAHEAASGFSATVRRFIGVVSDSDADYATLPRLRRLAVKDPRLVEVADFVEGLNAGLFDPHTPVDADAAYQVARAVVARWQ